jgi:hypothetical protein
MRTLEQLLDKTGTVWPVIQEWLKNATNPVEVLPASEPARSEALVAAQVTTRSPVGVIIFETGGLLIDNGWVRVLGSGHPRLPRSLPQWNLEQSVGRVSERPPLILIADDVVGGFFALNNGAFSSAPGTVHYFAPDILTWQSMDIGYSAFLQWLLIGDIAGFFADFRWEGWEEDVSALRGDKGFLISPSLSVEGPPVDERHRSIVPMAELYSLYVDEEDMLLPAPLCIQFPPQPTVTLNQPTDGGYL